MIPYHILIVPLAGNFPQEMIMNPDVQRFFDAVPDASKPTFNQMHELVMRLYPDATVKISYGIPIYKAKTSWVGLGFWKDGVSIYTNGPGHLA